MSCSSCSKASPLAESNLLPISLPIGGATISPIPIGGTTISNLPAGNPIDFSNPIGGTTITPIANLPAGNPIDFSGPVFDAIIEDELIDIVYSPPELSRGPTVKAFTSKGSVGLGESNDLFVKLAYSVPFAASAADSYITSQISKDLILGFEPTYFQIPYIYSAADNLVNGKYSSTTKSQGDLIINEYVIPYTGAVKEEYVLVTTYFNVSTKILFYEIPRVFSYNSKEKASVAVTPNGVDFVGKISIPSSFITPTPSPSKKDYILTLNISPDNVVTPLNTNGGAGGNGGQGGQTASVLVAESAWVGSGKK